RRATVVVDGLGAGRVGEASRQGWHLRETTPAPVLGVTKAAVDSELGIVPADEVALGGSGLADRNGLEAASTRVERQERGGAFVVLFATRAVSAASVVPSVAR